MDLFHVGFVADVVHAAYVDCQVLDTLEEGVETGRAATDDGV